METIGSLLLGFSVALQPDVLWYAFLGCLVGTVVGVLPGIGPLSGISILLPATFGLDTTKSIVMLAGIYYGSQYGGSTTSILMRIPGEASSVMTCIDGYAMARKGRAGAALCIAAVGSWVAGTFGVIMLTLIAPPLAAFALRFGPPEYAALLVLGLILLAYMSSSSLARTLLMACLGLLLGTIGIDTMTVATPKRSLSRSVATRSCISPWPHNTTSCASGLWTTLIEGSSSRSLVRAWPSLTSSFRSLLATAMASTGG